MNKGKIRLHKQKYTMALGSGKKIKYISPNDWSAMRYALRHYFYEYKESISRQTPSGAVAIWEAS